MEKKRKEKTQSTFNGLTTRAPSRLLSSMLLSVCYINIQSKIPEEYVCTSKLQRMQDPGKCSKRFKNLETRAIIRNNRRRRLHKSFSSRISHIRIHIARYIHELFTKKKKVDTLYRFWCLKG